MTTSTHTSDASSGTGTTAPAPRTRPTSKPATRSLPGCAKRSTAYGDPDSPTRGYFNFESDTKYEAWWGIDTLPKLNYENSGALCEEIFRIAEKWASPPYCIDGWRLDVGADLGHSREYNHLFWKEFRRRVKAVNPEVLLIAEH